MSEMFNEVKTPEIVKKISTGEFETIYNINIWSRYDEDRELIEMLWFCRNLKAVGLTDYIDELFYDSKVSLCSIRLKELDQDDYSIRYEIDAIRIIAQLTLEQFEIKGVIGHRNPYLSNKLKVII